ncbi:MAG: phosphoribosylanthranilate isomerase [Candidatus Theseobacter exili]|nr:phosphoribosylanthranilate isomerase [Candidatus Theseobacter exili]
MRVKICGITRYEDALLASNLGADAIGFIFYKKSSRYISPEKAGLISSAIEPFVVRVGVFVDADSKEVNEAINYAGLDLLQFHGSETNEFCCSFGFRFIKGIRVKGINSLKIMEEYPDASAFLLDTFVEGKPGGTGVPFDWDLYRESVKNRKTVVLSGGINPDNVKQAFETLQPYAVDVSSGVELSPGIKDPLLLHSFFSAVNNCK